jgi:hypothetical protein
MPKRRHSLATALGVLFAMLRLMALIGLAPAGPAAAAPQLVQIAGGLSSPVYATSARDGTGRLFFVERCGVIKVMRPGQTPTVFLDITSRVLSAGGEQGLLGLAFHPLFADNHRFFVSYTRQTDGATVVAEYQASTDNPDVALSAERVILTVPQPFANHNGGMIEFGPDGNLYIALGDGGDGDDPGDRAQNLDELLGKILRITVTDTTPAGAPGRTYPAHRYAGRDTVPSATASAFDQARLPSVVARRRRVAEGRAPRSPGPSPGWSLPRAAKPGMPRRRTLARLRP